VSASENDVVRCPLCVQVLFISNLYLSSRAIAEEKRHPDRKDAARLQAIMRFPSESFVDDR
jgi:hypothetical protein